MQQIAEVLLANFDRLGREGAGVADSLLEFTRVASPSLRGHALSALVDDVDPQHSNPKITARLREVLEGDEVALIREVLPAVAQSRHPLPFDATHLLFQHDESLRQQARRVIRYLHPAQDKNIGEFLLEVLEDPERAEVHVAAIRALAALGQSAMPAYATLEKLMMDRQQPMQSRIAAANALLSISGGNGPVFASQLREDFVNENRSRQETPEFRAELQQFDHAVQAEREAI
jgi:hypothetical protein